MQSDVTDQSYSSCFTYHLFSYTFPLYFQYFTPLLELILFFLIVFLYFFHCFFSFLLFLHIKTNIKQ